MIELNSAMQKTAPSLPDTSRLTVGERREAGKRARSQTPRLAHAVWAPAPERDVIGLLEASNVGRVSSLIPIRHQRMAVSPFTFYRGAPAVMAYDLAHTPSSGLVAQLCGDCHISNFGLYASPERDLVFDLNDFDETLPGPFEWDVKRAAASIVIAARNARLSEKTGRAAVRTFTDAYRRRMHANAALGYIDNWYRVVQADIFVGIGEKKHRKTIEAQLARVQSKDRMHALGKLTEVVDGQRRFVHQPPLIYRLDKSEDDIREWVTGAFTTYFESLDDSRKRLLSRYRLVDVAHKVVGVGSVGTRCFITYWAGRDEDDPLFLQVKQARQSLLEPYLGKSPYAAPGQRVVTGQRLMQATSDIFLGYAHAMGDDYFIRQLYDMKGSADLEKIPAVYLQRYAGLCGATLARAHSRPGDAVAISGYIGNSDRFDQALTAFALSYADQNEADYRAFKQAIADGRIEAADGN